MRFNKENPGYLLVYTLLSITIAMGIITIALSRVTVFTAMSQLIVTRAQARQLALGGIVLAISQLTIPEEKNEKPKPEFSGQDKKKEEPSEDPEKKELVRLLTLLNRWRMIKLLQQRDGIQGTIQFCITSEEGKIAINELYDFEKKKFVGEAEKKAGDQNQQQIPETTSSALVEKAMNIKEQMPDGRKVLDMICMTIRSRMGGSASVGEIEGLFKKRNRPLDDVTQLFELPGFSAFKHAVFIQPPEQQKQEKNEKALYLTDLFTVARSSPQIDPWLFSDSVRALLDLARVKQTDPNMLTPEQLKQLKTQINWPTEWDTFLKSLYGKDYASLPKQITPFFKPKFEGKHFAITTYGTVGKVTVKYYAIIERIPARSEQEKPTAVIKQLFQV
jgi:hypothetical protein